MNQKSIKNNIKPIVQSVNGDKYLETAYDIKLSDKINNVNNTDEVKLTDETCDESIINIKDEKNNNLNVKDKLEPKDEMEELRREFFDYNDDDNQHSDDEMHVLN